MSEEKTYTLEEMDVIIKDHITKNSQILRKNLREINKKTEVEYV